MVQIGVDFGTTHTTAAFRNGHQVHFIPLDPANKQPHLLRSMIYLTRAHDVTLGVTAVRDYLRQNIGRLVHLQPKKVGTIENTVARQTRTPWEPDGPIVIVHDVLINEDVGAPGRLLQSIKTGLRDPDYRGTMIFGRFFSLPELIALILAHVKKQAEAECGTVVTAVRLGRPVKFAESAEQDALAQARLYEAARLAGFTQIAFEQEPVAAAQFYTRSLERSQKMLVFDFGGGTLDLTVIHYRGAGQTEVLATYGVLVGGDDIDSSLMRHRAAPYLGTESSIDAAGHPFPAHLATKMQRWQTLPELSRPQHLRVIRQAQQHGNNSTAFAALECLVRRNYGFALFEQIEQVKRALSTQATAVFAMQVEAIDISFSLSRRDFQSAIVAEMAQVQQGIAVVLQLAGLQAEQIDAVLTTGGSSLIPVFQSLLSRRFTAAQLVRSDTFGSVAAGLALQGDDGLR